MTRLDHTRRRCADEPSIDQGVALFRRTWIQVLLVTLIGAASQLIAVHPAAADAPTYPGVWRSYQLSNYPPTVGTSTWTCGPYRNVEPDGTVSGRPCMIKSADGKHKQGAVLVLNLRSTAYSVQAAMELRTTWDITQTIARWECGRSGMAPKSYSVCFGETRQAANPLYLHRTGVNGQEVGSSSSV